MVTKIQIYNGALGYIGTTRLHDTTGLTENRPERFELDAKYAGALQYLMECGLWKWALRSQELTFDPDYSTSFGPTYRFNKPQDFVRLAGISRDGYFRAGDEPDYTEEGGAWFSDDDTIWIKYVSNGTSYGLNLGRYTQTYCEALFAWLAYKSTLPISKDRGDRNDILQQHKLWLDKAKVLDAVDEAVKFKPLGSLARARIGTGAGISGIRNGRLIR